MENLDRSIPKRELKRQYHENAIKVIYAAIDKDVSDNMLKDIVSLQIRLLYQTYFGS